MNRSVQIAIDKLKNGKKINNLKQITVKDKLEIIDNLRCDYSLKNLLESLKLSHSTYYYQKNIQNRPDKYQDLRIKIKDIFYASNKTFGYRRIKEKLAQDNIIVSEKVIMRLMKEAKLSAKGNANRYN